MLEFFSSLGGNAGGLRPLPIPQNWSFMLTIANLTLTHRKDLTVLVDSLFLTVSDGERLALIGEEGNGKSTLLRVLAGNPSVNDYIEVSGSFSCRGRAGYLPQELPKDEREKSAYDFFCASPTFFDLSPKDLGQLAARLALPADVFYSPQRMADFSGGERVKLQLARLLMASPDVLLLDEPTNDLDGGSVRWLEDFLLSCKLTVLFVSHDEALLSRTATSILLLERLRRRQVPRATLYRMGYDQFYAERGAAFEKQIRIARKEREDFDAKMERYDAIRRKVERDQNAISRQDPHGSRLLKKKMHTVQAMGRRFEREQENMTAMPEQEEAIFAKLDCAPLPADKTVLDLSCAELSVGGRTLCRDIRLTVRAREKLCICGHNGVGKSTLLHLIRNTLEKRSDLRVFYMPQDAGDLLDFSLSPVELLSPSGKKEERSRAGILLGSMKFTADEMNHPSAGLSGGQKAKLMFLMMAESGANILLLDEPTRNLSPLSGPVIRELLAEYPGCIITVSHDRRLIQEVCTRTVTLTPEGVRPSSFCDNF